MSYEDIRQQQVNEVRRTLSVKPGHKRPTQGRPNRPAVSKGHDAILKLAQDKGERISITLASGVNEEGKVTGRDKYTITLDKTRVIYKHAIDRFVVPASLFGVEE